MKTIKFIIKNSMIFIFIFILLFFSVFISTFTETINFTEFIKLIYKNNVKYFIVTCINRLKNIHDSLKFLNTRESFFKRFKYCKRYLSFKII